MSPYTIQCFLIFSAIVSSVLCTEDERLRFSPNFSANLGVTKGHSIGISGNKDGISLSQSSTLGGSGPVAGSLSNSFSAGSSGIGISDASAYNIFGKSKTNSNSYTVGDADASSQADVKDGKVSSGAQSSAGTEHNKVSSGASSSVAIDEAAAEPNTFAVQNEQYPSRPLLGHRNTNRHIGLHHLIRRPHHQESRLGIHIRKFHSREPNRWQNGSPDVSITKWNPDSERDLPCYGIPGCGEHGHFEPKKPKLNIRPHPAEYPQQNYPQQNYPQQNYPQQNYPQQNYPQQNYPQQNYPQQQESWPLKHQQRREGTRVSVASASSSASSSGNGYASSHSSSESNLGHNGLSSQTKNQLNTAGNAESHAISAAASVQADTLGQTQGSFSSGNIAGSSQGHGQTSGIAVSENKGEHSQGNTHSSISGPGSAGGNANAGAVSFDDSLNSHLGQEDDILPSEFVRSGWDEDKKKPAEVETGRTRTEEKKGPIRKILTHLNTAVSSIFHH